MITVTYINKISASRESRRSTTVIDYIHTTFINKNLSVSCRKMSLLTSSSWSKEEHRALVMGVDKHGFDYMKLMVLMKPYLKSFGDVVRYCKHNEDQIFQGFNGS